MTIEEKLLDNLRALPPDKKKQLLEFAEQLREDAPKKPLRGFEGIWEDLGVDLSKEEIDEARREMWGNFPREIK